MIRLITGFPGASKSLNTVKEVVEDLDYAGRPVYYYNIKALILDLDFACSFAGWFYGTWLPGASGDDLERVLPIVRAVHKKAGVVTEDDLPFLVCYWRQAPIYQTWIDWVLKLYPEKKTAELRRFLDACEHFDFKPTKKRLERFNLHWKKMSHPHDWYKLPYGSVMIIDEAQEFFPPRSVGAKVPEYIAKMNVHRHSGFDLHLVTQQPRLVDTQIRSVTGRHIHFHNPDNGEKVVRYQSSKLMDVENESSLKDCLNLSYKKRDAKFYGSYYSAEIHTHKKITPDFYKKIIPALLAVLVGIGGAGYVLMQLGLSEVVAGEADQTVNQDLDIKGYPGENGDFEKVETTARCLFVGERRICR
ncbi:zonular occludens toxin domain-containing protein [Oceanimonas marisflavi]|uniref:zonular occludens toxin domain-containing protein n=1 Tax=Oceanimonas marisflavi TaxID=2059724 RepID=UPI000D323DEC|nr:zonular occludens toxin domain-containing protein [Oceanimonas marisflavi]